MAKTLTAAAVMKLLPASSRREIPDGGCPGLYLVIQPSGHRSWAMRFRRPSGKTSKLTLGPVDLSGQELDGEPELGAPLTLASARRLAAEIHRGRARGRDVVADIEATKRRQKAELQVRVANTFGTAARDFILNHARAKTRRWQAQARILGLEASSEQLETIAKGLAERWGQRPIVEIDSHDIYILVDEVRRIGVPGLRRRSDKPTESQARAMFACLSKMFSWLEQHRRVQSNPCKGVHRPDPSIARDRVLTTSEIVTFWSAANSERSDIGVLLKLLLLTGCRLNEVAGMRRSELNDDTAAWTIPGQRTKNRRPHIVPIAPLARKLINSIPVAGDLVFTTTGRSPVSGWSKIKARLDRTMETAPWRIHDLRRTAATGMAELGVPPHIVEAALNHISGAKAGVAGTYNRAAYASEKKLALERWAHHISAITDGRDNNVVDLRGTGSWA